MVVLRSRFRSVSAMTPTQQDDVPASVTVPKVLRTRKQLQAAAVSELALLHANWKRAIPGAQLRWPKLDPVELAQARGNMHRLAGLVQLRYQLTREQADQQVAEFLAVPA